MKIKNLSSYLLVSLLFWGSNDYAFSQARPNIVILSVDDMNYNSCGVMGQELKNITPNINRLAKSGILFKQGYVPTAVCVPCRTPVMTGVYPHKVSQWDGFGKAGITEDIPQSGYDIKEGTPTLVKSLKAAGYFTGILAKPNHHQPYSEFPWDIVYGHHKYEDLKHGRDAGLFAKRTEEVVQKAKKEGKPFFLSANVCDPHRPFPGSVAEEKRIESGSFGGSMPKPSHAYTSDEVETLGFLPDLPEVRKETAEYFSGVRRADDCVGAVLEKLKEMGVEKETIILFFSDNGAPFPFSKECCTMNGIRTPIIVKWPGKVSPNHIDSTTLVSVLDFAPSVLDIIKMPRFKTMDGMSLLPLLEGKTNKLRDAIFSVYHFTPGHAPIQQRSVLKKGYTYIFDAFAVENKFFDSGDPRAGYTYKAMKQAGKNNDKIKERVQFYDYRVPEELYDNRLDPNSKINLINQQAQIGLKQELRKEMLKWMVGNQDPLLPYYRKYLTNTHY